MAEQMARAHGSRTHLGGSSPPTTVLKTARATGPDPPPGGGVHCTSAAAAEAEGEGFAERVGRGDDQVAAGAAGELLGEADDLEVMG